MYNERKNTGKETQMLGFSWGYSLQNKESQQEQSSKVELQQQQQQHGMAQNMSSSMPSRNKRHHDDDTDVRTSQDNNTTNNISTNNNVLLRKYMVAKKKPTSTIHNASTSNTISVGISDTRSTSTIQANKSSTCGSASTYIAMIEGQSLPLERSLDLMDKSQLQNVIMDLLQIHPQVAQHLQSSLSQYSFTNERRLVSLKLKFQEIYSSIPYNKQYTDNGITRLDDYAFGRLNPLILEFLNCLTDYILNTIPPRSTNLQESIIFLQECTQMVCQLPRFSLPSNNYYYDKCLEQLSHIWCTLIQHLSQQTNTSTILLINSQVEIKELYDKLNQFNDLANNLLIRPLQLLKYNIENPIANTNGNNNPTNEFNNNILATNNNKNTF
ncbi:Tethering factor for nuclear proteasome sts1 [Maudiozyma exigua]|uniref:Tethering factor for nuclear proteasome STS1 n=1 Tax=Maudiozyma exigua TaxID=34358 RepID=A0A9P6VW80_MAUEX|nr:Tethering factor for nuclear proteasome sts1 [Kazachstania exigua]